MLLTVAITLARATPTSPTHVPIQAILNGISRTSPGGCNVPVCNCILFDWACEHSTEGVTPEALMRHVLGEDLNVGCVLSWGPCWYAQKQFFEGETSPLSTDRNLMRYDVEVSGFPSSHTGHLCFLRLREDD